MSRRPVDAPYTITTEFGVPDSYAKFGYHSGVDYAVPGGRAVYAPASGQLTNVESPTGGKMVVIYDGQFYHRLMHNMSYSRINGSVQEGEEVSKADSTGLSTGNHVHWDINGEGTYPSSFAAFIPPADWLAGAYAPPTPPAPQPTQRVLSNPTGVNQRAAPSTSAAIIKEWPFDQEPFNFKGYVRGEAVNGNNIWFVGAISGGYFYSGAFQGGSDTNGLQDLTPAPKEEPIPIPPPAPTLIFEKELDCVTRVIPANSTNYEVGNFPSSPEGVVLHDFGTDGKDTLQSSLNHFQNQNTTAPHFTVSGSQIIQNGKLSWRMYHAGPQGNDKVGIEIDPDVDTNMETKRSVITLLAQLDAHYKKSLTRYLHSQFMATSCGDDITKANLLIPQNAPTEPTDVEKRLSALEKLVKLITDFLDKIFKNWRQ